MLKIGLVRESNPGPLAPEARIIPLDQRATIDQIVMAVRYLLRGGKSLVSIKNQGLVRDSNPGPLAP